MFGRAKVAALVAEFTGGATLTLIYLAVRGSQVGISWFIAFSVGLAAAMLTLKLSAASGAHANPAITFGLWTIRKITTTRALVYIASQLLGGLSALMLYGYLSNQEVMKLAESTIDWRVFVAELVGAFILSFGVASAVYQNYDSGKRAATVGGALFLAMLVAGIASNGTVNPAVALGSRSINLSYFVGPAAGAVLGMNLYALLFAPIGSFRLLPTSAAPRVVSKPVAVKRTTTRTTTKRKK